MIKTRISLMIVVPRTRLELARPCGHYPLKVACLPISPSGQNSGAKLQKIFFNSTKKTTFVKSKQTKLHYE